MPLSASSDSIVDILEPDQVEEEGCHTVGTVQDASKHLTNKNKRVSNENTKEYWRNTINISPSYAAYRSQFTNNLEQLQGR